MSILVAEYADFPNSIRTPANWMPGGDVIIPRAVKDEEAKVSLIVVDSYFNIWPCFVHR